MALLINPYSFGWALGTSIVRALGEAPLTAVIFGMMGDVIEFGQWKTHIRQEALIFGGGSLGFKLGTGITSAIITALLDKAGYISSSGAAGVVQPESAVTMIRNIYVWGPTLIWIVAVVTLLVYQLDKKYAGIMADLSTREAKGEL
jgi:GPH family glycoside/pentoside/hexuronide:cation symporter